MGDGVGVTVAKGGAGVEEDVGVEFGVVGGVAKFKID
jgi:hypothetical protein